MKSVESDIMSSSEASSMFCNSFWRGRGREEGERGRYFSKEGGNKTFTFI